MKICMKAGEKAACDMCRHSRPHDLSDGCGLDCPIVPGGVCGDIEATE
jgi:hypothetical protein